MQDGRLLFAHYAFMPNKLGYCGGADSQALLDYCVNNEADAGIEQLIRQFQAAYPYLCFISQSNGISNPFDRRVVEAYWIGNSLLENVGMSQYYDFLRDKMGPRMSKKALEQVIGKLPSGAHPHHSFHVLDVSMKTGALKESIEELDSCRISWGEVKSVEGSEIVVSYRPLALLNSKLALGESTERRAFYKVQDQSYLDQPEPGDLVSMHWNWVCDRLTEAQASRLKRQTEHHIAIANQTI